jgi:transcriptional regulator with XRE-family HTH domain
MERNSSLASDLGRTNLQAFGTQIRTQRKALHLGATVVAEAAGISRVTLHRIEKGEPSVAMGAWYNVLSALGMVLQARNSSSGETGSPQMVDRSGWIPARVALADYPQLRALAWQVHGTDTVTPSEALDIYERNARHLDLQAMSGDEHALLQALRLALQRPQS